MQLTSTGPTPGPRQHFSRGWVGRAGIDGNNPEQLFHRTFDGAYGLSLSANPIYYTTDGAINDTATLYRMPLAGGEDDGFLHTELAHRWLRGIAVDGAHVYWGDTSEGAIHRANLELEESSFEVKFIEAEGSLDGLTIDGDQLYWSANGEAPSNPGNDLYRYKASTGKLTDIAPDPADPNGAEVQGVLGSSEDGSYLYFVANGVLAAGASPGTCHLSGSLSGPATSTSTTKGRSVSSPSWTRIEITAIGTRSWNLIPPGSAPTAVPCSSAPRKSLPHMKTRARQSSTATARTNPTRSSVSPATRPG